MSHWSNVFAFLALTHFSAEQKHKHSLLLLLLIRVNGTGLVTSSPYSFHNAALTICGYNSENRICERCICKRYRLLFGCREFALTVWFSFFWPGFSIPFIPFVNHKGCQVNNVNSGSSSTDLETLFFLWLNAQLSPVKEALTPASS